MRNKYYGRTRTRAARATAGGLAATDVVHDPLEPVQRAELNRLARLKVQKKCSTLAIIVDRSRGVAH